MRTTSATPTQPEIEKERPRKMHHSRINPQPYSPVTINLRVLTNCTPNPKPAEMKIVMKLNCEKGKINVTETEKCSDRLEQIYKRPHSTKQPPASTTMTSSRREFEAKRRTTRIVMGFSVNKSVSHQAYGLHGTMIEEGGARQNRNLIVE